MTLQVSTLSTATASFATRAVTLHGVAWSNTSTTDRTITFRDARSATATTSVFTLDALGREHGAFRIAGGGKRFDVGLSASKIGTRVTVTYDDYS